jgi:hypothetical protein
MSRKKTKPQPRTQRRVKFNLAKEVRYIQRRAAERDARFVTVGELAFFSCESGDAWMLDPSDHFAAQIARDGDPEPIEFRGNGHHLRHPLDGPLSYRWRGIRLHR